MKTRVIALTFLVLHLAILLFICATWYKYNKNVFEYGGEIADGVFAIFLLVATIYYFGLAAWTYSVYKKAQRNEEAVQLQLIVILVLGILAPGFLFYKLSF